MKDTYDSMILSLLRKMSEDINQMGIKIGDPKLDEELLKALESHLNRMPEFQQMTKAELEREESEQKKKITSDDIRPGFDSAVSFCLFIKDRCFICYSIHPLNLSRLQYRGTSPICKRQRKGYRFDNRL
jgi:hypothetical protein